MFSTVVVFISCNLFNCCDGVKFSGSINSYATKSMSSSRFLSS